MILSISGHSYQWTFTHESESCESTDNSVILSSRTEIQVGYKIYIDI
jgi:hypothetical protein